MNPILSIFRHLSLSLCFSLCLSAQSSGDPSDLNGLEDSYILLRREAHKPLKELTDRYVAALGKCKADFQSAGNLDGIIEVNKAIEEIGKGILPDGKSADATLQKYEQVYLTQKEEAERSIERQLAKASETYLGLLTDLMTRLTKQGKIDEALKVREKVETEKRLHPPVAAAATSGKGAVKVLAASYGTGGKTADVTETVRQFVEIKKQDFTVTPGHLGVDPNPGWNKGFTVRYLKDGVERKQNRGENETLLIESFYGPQDNDEVKRWLVGTRWKSNVDITFNGDSTFTIGNRLGTYRWDALQYWGLTLVWPDEGVIEYAFDWRWDSFREKQGKRIFKKTK